MNKHGFTLIEMLVVIALVGIMSTMLSLSLMNSIKNQRVREAANELASRIQQAKTSTAKSSLGSSVSWNPAAPTQYSVITGAKTVNYTLSNDMKLTCVAVAPVPCPTNNRIDFLAPAGESSTGLILKIEPSNGTTGAPQYIKVVGLIGKVSVNATSN